MADLLPTIQSPKDLRELSNKQLNALAAEIRETLCALLGTRSAHFASNMGAVEICLALHSTFDFLKDRLIWDTGHQAYPHKLITGRYKDFDTIRTKGGLMGYPNPEESPYDLFVTGHAGASVSTAVGLQIGDDIRHPEEHRHSVAVIGDGAFASGMVFEAMNHGGWLKKNFTVVLNDNAMSICPRVGGMGRYLDRLRMGNFYTHLKADVHKIIQGVPLVGKSTERLLSNLKEALKAGLVGGMMFEGFGFNYIGPIDGHNIAELKKCLTMARDFDGPVIVHALTNKGYGLEAAEEDPTTYHAPAPFTQENGKTVASTPKPGKADPYTKLASDGILEAMRADERVCVITAAMCQGNMLEPIREEFEDRFFDVGICESHAVGFAAGLAKTGMRPVVDVYSTFMQRSYDQIFQEVSLQNLPIVMFLDRAGLTGPDGKTHHGVFDLAYMRPFPNLVVMAPGDAADMRAMARYAIDLERPVAVRYPKCEAHEIERTAAPVELGKAEVIREGGDGALVACGTLLENCVEVAATLAEEGVELTVVNARFLKPMDTETILPLIQRGKPVVTVEEGMLAGGFGSAVLEAANDAGLDTSKVKRLGFGDLYVEHGTRKELLADHGLDTPGILDTCRKMLAR